MTALILVAAVLLFAIPPVGALVILGGVVLLLSANEVAKSKKSRGPSR